MKKLITITCFFLFALQATASPSWVVKSAMPAAKGFFGAVYIDTFIYAVGGFDGSGSTTNLYAYNIYTDTWTTKASMSYARGELGVALVNGKIYAIGGYTGSGPSSAVEEYNPATNSWTTKSSMPTARSQFSCAVIGNKIYCVGGWPGSYTNLEVYDPSTDSWATKTSEPFGRIEYNGGAALGGKFYFMGGKDYWNSVTYDTNTVYNPSTDTWSSAVSMPQARYGGAVTVLQGKIYYMGGTDGGTWVPTYSNNDYYDTSSGGSWHSSVPLIYSRSNAAAVTVNNNIYLIGGIDSDENVIAWNHELTDTQATSWGPSNSVITNNGNSTTINGTKTTTVANSINNTSINIYPNPCRTAFTIKISSGYTEEAKVEIVDVVGQKVKEVNILTNLSSGIQINASPGIYTVIATTIHGKSINKLVIE